MSYFAKVINNRVQEVIVADQEVIDSGAFGDPVLWIETSPTGSFRYNYAAVGYSYNALRDAFIPPKPYPSWLLNEETCQWYPPVEMPQDGLLYTWDEITKSWILVEQSI